MIALAEIFRQHGPAYRAKYGSRMPHNHLRAMADIEHCRTEVMGGHLYACDACEQSCYSYHSCQNRHCPKCQNEAGQTWLARQKALLLPTPYFMVTFTLPEALRTVARSNQKLIYNLLFRCSAGALQELAQDPRFVGGQIGMVGVLQTWTRDLRYHPHIHYLVPGGGLSPDGQTWLSSHNKFFVHVKPLGRLFRGKFRTALQQTDLFEQVPSSVWQQDWVVHCQPVGTGEAALTYLAPYIFRVALSQRRLLKCEDGQVTFRYREPDKPAWRVCTLAAEEFIRRFLQHVLPKGFQKVRYYGLFSSALRPHLAQAQQLLGFSAKGAPQQSDLDPTQTKPPSDPTTLSCPTCGQPLRHLHTLPRLRCRSP